jgi:hypothetical protein
MSISLSKMRDVLIDGLKDVSAFDDKMTIREAYAYIAHEEHKERVRQAYALSHPYIPLQTVRAKDLP